MNTPITDKAFQEAHDQNLPEFGEGWQGFTEYVKRAMGELEAQRAEAIEIARNAIGAIETIYGHAQFCDQCQSFEIAKQCRDELHGFDRLNSLENAKGDSHSPEQKS